MPHAFPLPADFVRQVERLGGAAGRAWLRELPASVEHFARRWGLRVGPPYPLSYNFVAPAVQGDGVPVVLKLCAPGDPDWRHEAEALRLLDGWGSVRLLDVDHAQRVMLLERAVPATPLAELVRVDDEAATKVVAGVMRRLHRPAPVGAGFPTVQGWGAGFGRLRRACGGGGGPLPGRVFARAEQVFDELCASAGAPVLLHGDLHYDNIVAARREPWLAIDPKGVIGEAAYEAGAVLRNPRPELLELAHPERVVSRRIELLAAELDADAERIRAWAFAQAMLSAVWMLEDTGEGWEFPVACAELLAD